MTHDDIVESIPTVDKPQPSKRAKRKAAQRDKKQQAQKQLNTNKATSLHPEAIMKRNKKQQPPTSSQSKRRKHNFSERANFLLESERENEEFDTSLDQLTNIAIDSNANGSNSDVNGDKEVVHKLHSRKVSELVVKSTTADDVVKAIKRAQNLHDVHDIREIAHFLLEDVGKLVLFCSVYLLNIHPAHIYLILFFLHTSSIIQTFHLHMAIEVHYYLVLQLQHYIWIIMRLQNGVLLNEGYLIVQVCYL